MTYNPSIPQAGDLISASQSQILANFAAIDSSSSGFAVDHTTLTDATNGGKHKKMTMVQQVAGPTTAVSEAAIYTKSVTTDALVEPEVYVRQQSSGTEFLLTRGAPVMASGEGVMYGGLQVRAGTGTASIAGTVVTYGTKFPTATIAVATSPNSSSAVAQTSAYTATSFTATAVSNGVSFNWIAIGY